MRFLIAVFAALSPLVGHAQSYPSPTFQDVTVRGNVTTTGISTGTTSVGIANIVQRMAAVRATDNPQYNQPMTIPTRAASTVYWAGERIAYGSGPTLYFEQMQGPSCTSSAGAGPTAVGSLIVDNDCLWSSYPATPTGNAPTITAATQWTQSTSYSATAVAVTFSGSGASRLANFYTNGGACTSAGAGLGPSGAGPAVDNTCTWTRTISLPGAEYGGSSANSYVWNSAAGRLATVANLYGGTTSTSGLGYLVMLGATVDGVKSGSTQARYEFTTTAPKIIVRAYEINLTDTGWRFLVCNPDGAQCQYVSPNRTIPKNAGFSYYVLDFSSVGGRQPRMIVLEGAGSSQFSGIDIALTDDIHKPNTSYPLSMAVMGDSYPAGGGVKSAAFSFPLMAGDMLGFRNNTNTAIGGCGYGPVCSSGTALSRINDVFTANNGAPPDMLLISNGTNDQYTKTPSQIASSALAYIAAIRANAAMTKTPIFHLGVYAFATGGTACTTCTAIENAVSAAIVGLHDPYAFFCPWTTDPAGAWETGTGNVAANNGTGNSDFQYNGASNGHDNAYANRVFAERIVSCVRSNLNTAKY